jgi:hypothetical protein
MRSREQVIVMVTVFVNSKLNNAGRGLTNCHNLLSSVGATLDPHRVYKLQDDESMTS